MSLKLLQALLCGRAEIFKICDSMGVKFHKYVKTMSSLGCNILACLVINRSKIPFIAECIMEKSSIKITSYTLLYFC